MTGINSSDDSVPKASRDPKVVYPQLLFPNQEIFGPLLRKKCGAGWAGTRHRVGCGPSTAGWAARSWGLITGRMGGILGNSTCQLQAGLKMLS